MDRTLVNPDDQLEFNIYSNDYLEFCHALKRLRTTKDNHDGYSLELFKNVEDGKLYEVEMAPNGKFVNHKNMVTFKEVKWVNNKIVKKP